jgi:hypothetical protein
MPRLEYFIAAESVSIDQDTNRTHILNVLEEIVCAGLPTVYPGCAVIAGWICTAEDVGQWEATIRISVPGQDTHEGSLKFEVAEGTKRHRTIMRFAGVPLAAEGELKFQLLLNGEHKATHSTDVRMLTELERSKFVDASVPRSREPRA